MYARPASQNQEQNQPTTFGVSGKLWRDALIMYDRDSRSLWSQIDGVAKAGPQKGARLEKIPSQITTWDAWRRQHPETLVLVKPELEESPYASYHDGAPFVGLPWTRGGRDDRLPSKELVLGIDLAEKGAAAATIDKLGREKLLSGRLGDAELLIVAAGDPRAAQVFSRRVAGKTLDFDWQGDQLVDLGTGSVWQPSDGRATEGPLAGEQLEAIAATPIYWATWISFHPQTELW